MMGSSEKVNSRMAGSSASSGSSGLARSTFSRICWSASSMLTVVSNSAVTLEYPSMEVEESSLMSEMVLSSSSMGRVTSVSMSAGDTPG